MEYCAILCLCLHELVIQFAYSYLHNFLVDGICFLVFNREVGLGHSSVLRGLLETEAVLVSGVEVSSSSPEILRVIFAKLLFLDIEFILGVTGDILGPALNIGHLLRVQLTYNL